MTNEPSNEPIFVTPPESGGGSNAGGGNFLTANTTNHRRTIIVVATMLFGVFTGLVFYKIPITFRDVIIPPIVGLAVFEFLFRTRRRLSLKTLPVYIVVVTIVSQVLYSILYQLSYFGGPWNPLDSLIYLFTELPYGVYVLIDSSVVTGLAFYLIKIYRNESWQFADHSNQPQPEGDNDKSKGFTRKVYTNHVEKQKDFLIGFLGWWAISALVWTVATAGILSIDGWLEFLCLIPLFYLAQVVTMIRLASRRKWIAFGILSAIALNLFITLVIGLTQNAACFAPFFIEIPW